LGRQNQKERNKKFSQSNHEKRNDSRRVRRRDGGDTSDDPSSGDDDIPHKDRSFMSKKKEHDSNSETDDGDDEFYLSNRSIPSHLGSKLREQMSRFFAKIRQTVEKTRRARKILRTSKADVQEMTNDELITSVKADRRGYEHAIQELDTCREEMMTLSCFLGRRISSRKRVICQSISNDAQGVVEMAEECMIMMRDLVK
jgi:hypothetical protein